MKNFGLLTLCLFSLLDVALAQDITPLQELNIIEMDFFNSEYSAAEKRILNLLEKDADNKYLNLYCAISKLGNNKPNEALTNLAKVYDITNAPEIISPIIYMGKGQYYSAENTTTNLYFSKNKGFSFDPKIPYNNICLTEDEQSLVYLDATASMNKIYYLKKENNLWSNPIDISTILGSDGTYFPSCISNDGKRIYFTHYDEFESNIYVSTNDGKNWSALKKLNSSINSMYSESRAFENEDGTVLYFASNRPNGFGGMDLYFSNKLNKDWGKPVNCGARINTNLNEDYPTVCMNGRKLMFSSQGIKKGVDGYDIYICSMLSDNQWTEPINLGYPFNSSDDDLTYTALTSPTRKAFGLLNNQGKSLYKLNVQVKIIYENLPETTVNIADLSGKNTFGDVVPDSTGVFSVNVSEGFYKISFNLKGKTTGRYLIVPVITEKDILKFNILP